jgi:dihydroorotate dehydrogenase electron transfer subunit
MLIFMITHTLYDRKQEVVKPNKYAGFYPLIAKKQVSASIFKLIFEAEDIANSARPGQFIQIRAGDNCFPFWPRPFSIHESDPANGRLAILFKIYGKGTSQIASMVPGEKVHLFGPLGNGFPSIPGDREIIMTAGGVGLPPLYFVAKRSISEGLAPSRIFFIVGAKTRTELLEEKGLYEMGIKLIICTDDGSEGFKGHVVDFLKRNISEYPHPIVYACGPEIMLRGIDRLILERKLSGYLSLEALMPCGYGICSGCAVKVHPPPDRGPTDDNRDYHLKRVCVDGPVFGSGEVIW